MAQEKTFKLMNGTKQVGYMAKTGNFIKVSFVGFLTKLICEIGYTNFNLDDVVGGIVGDSSDCWFSVNNKFIVVFDQRTDCSVASIYTVCNGIKVFEGSFNECEDVTGKVII